MKVAARRLALTATAVLVALIGLAWPLRPSPPWAAAAPAASEGKDVFAFLGWLGFMILALGLLERAVTNSIRRLRVVTLALSHLNPLPRPMARRQTGGGYSTTAFPLIPKAATAPNTEAEIGSEQPESLRQATPAEIQSAIGRASSDLPPERGRHELWRSIGDARKQLGETALQGERDLYLLDSTQITTDVDELEHLTARVDGQANAARRLAVLESALALFRGEPLAATDYLWADGDIRRLRATRLHITEQAGQARLDTGDPAGALAAAEQRIADDPCNERLARLAMRAEAALGLRNAVIARHEGLCRRLDEHLGLRPDPETRLLYRQLLGQDTTGAAPPEVASLQG